VPIEAAIGTRGIQSFGNSWRWIAYLLGSEIPIGPLSMYLRSARPAGWL